MHDPHEPPQLLGAAKLQPLHQLPLGEFLGPTRGALEEGDAPIRVHLLTVVAHAGDTSRQRRPRLDSVMVVELSLDRFDEVLELLDVVISVVKPPLALVQLDLSLV
jgi:hypothetical protein